MDLKKKLIILPNLAKSAFGVMKRCGHLVHMTQHKITVGFTYYDNFSVVPLLVDQYQNIPADVIVVDDGSPIRPLTRSDIPNEWRLLRVKEDIGWNNEGCRNLIAHVTKTDWILFHDIDTMIKKECFDLLQDIDSLELDTDTVYHICERSHSRSESRNQSAYYVHQHIVVFRDTFWKHGGYDETYNGYYGFDYRGFRNKCNRDILPEIESIHLKAGPSNKQLKTKRGWGWEEKDFPVFEQTDEKLRFEWYEDYSS